MSCRAGSPTRSPESDPLRLSSRTSLAVAASIVLVAAGCASLGGERVTSFPDLKELAWVSTATDPVAFLSTAPASCVNPDNHPLSAGSIRAGELAFGSPALLGGQAGKIGLSCAACHRNGRGNPHFFVPAVSDKPGQADVTSGVFGKHRADDTHNPVPIPDLATADGMDQVDRSDRAALVAFTHSQITEEFSGEGPPLPVMDALIAYMQAIDPQACGVPGKVARRWQDDWQAARDADGLARGFRTGEVDEASAAFYVRTARAALGRLHERYDGPEHADIRADLETYSLKLAAQAPIPLADLDRLAEALEAGAPSSLYDVDVLRARFGL